MKHFLPLLLLLFVNSGILSAQNYTEILGRPTNSEITISILFDQPAEVFWEYGTTTGNLTSATPVFFAEKDLPLEKEMNGLIPDTRYFYRTRYRLSGSQGSYASGPEHSFQTPRKRGASFRFAIEADPHLDTNSNPASYSLTLQNILAARPDFMIDLGDIFMSEKQPGVNQSIITERHLLYRPYFNAVCHSVPLYLVMGNHEGEAGWLLNGSSASIPVMTNNTRKLYYPNPSPNAFYSGDSVMEDYVGLREDYYAWEWGDALIIVLDPYWHTTNRPDWGWTLGKEQYDWFRETISNSTARYKFVFCHHLVGGKGMDTRGGTEYAGFFEMGGSNTDGSWGFDTYRPGWGKPIHQLMAENHTSVFFHGHDHFYAKQEKDGVIYQEVPQPSNRNITNMNASKYGYAEGVLLPGRGYLLVSVSDSGVRVDYVKTLLPNEENGGSKNGDVAYSYTLPSAASGTCDQTGSAESFRLEPNTPNPFSGETTLHYSLTARCKIQLTVCDLFGREVCRLADQVQQPGSYSLSFKPADFALGEGVYYCRLKAGADSRCLKMICIP
jgi:hypothetical protein